MIVFWGHKRDWKRCSAMLAALAPRGLAPGTLGSGDPPHTPALKRAYIVIHLVYT